MKTLKLSLLTAVLVLSGCSTYDDWEFRCTQPDSYWQNGNRHKRADVCVGFRAVAQSRNCKAINGVKHCEEALHNYRECDVPADIHEHVSYLKGVEYCIAAEAIKRHRETKYAL